MTITNPSEEMSRHGGQTSRRLASTLAPPSLELQWPRSMTPREPLMKGDKSGRGRARKECLLRSYFQNAQEDLETSTDPYESCKADFSK